MKAIPRFYETISMDPPWPEHGGGKCKRGADRHYKLIKTKEDILRVVLQATQMVGKQSTAGRLIDQPVPVFRPDPKGCLLFCWATRNHLPKAVWLVEALGFRYVTDWVWVKGEAIRLIESSGGIDAMFKLARGGLGQWSQSLHEHLLMARIGKVELPTTGSRPSSVIVAPREEHSVKPAVFYGMIEHLGEGPRLEMFARAPRPGWDVWGDEAGG